MSTRCMIKLKSDKNELMLYHHHDGYPEGVGSDLISLFYKRLTNIDHGLWLSTVANELLKNKKDKGYEITFGIHTDIEYMYEIDLSKASISCKAVHYDSTKEDFIVDDEYNLLDYICLFDTKNMTKSYDYVLEDGKAQGRIVFDMTVGKRLYDNVIEKAFVKFTDYKVSVKQCDRNNLKDLHVTIILPSDEVNELADKLIDWFDVFSE